MNTREILIACAVTVIAALPLWSADVVPTGPATEKRFPALQVPAGFKATLFACDPLIEYPSVIALGPRARTVFVAHDYVTGLGVEIVRRDEVRLVEDSDGDGYADKSTVCATGFNSIQGLAYDHDIIFVMHAPLLTSLKDTNGDGVADERRDLLSGLGLTPEQNDTRLHCANGVTAGHDGWLYLSLGDHGCEVPRPEGDRLLLQGGGILRCRPDGRDLHIFARGLRNIYDVALDDELNVFVRDNENDGGTYKNRVCQSFFGADHGYPYLYDERPEEALPPLASLGLGSSAGGVCYLASAFPAEYRGNLFFCEWGRALMRYPRERASGSQLAPMKEIEFASAAPNDPYGFKLTDVIADRDGSLLVSDWGDGQRPKRGRGRIYRIAYAGLEELKSDVSSAEAEASNRRNRMRSLWTSTHSRGQSVIPELLEIARNDKDDRVRVQAVRALADLADPVIIQHKLDVARSDATLAASLADMGRTATKPVLLEIIVALGRLHWAETASWLKQHLREPDAALSHAAMQALRESRNWPSVVALLDEPDASPIRLLALRAMAGQWDTAIAEGLQQRLQADPNPNHRKEYADALTRICRKPGPWVYWNYRPAPRPPNTVSWEQTTAIGGSLNRALADIDRGVRLATLHRMQREQIPAQLDALSVWLKIERDPDSVAAIIECLRDKPAQSMRDLCGDAVRESGHTESNRLAFLNLFARGLDTASADRLLALAQELDDTPILANALRHLGTHPALPSRSFVRGKLDSLASAVRSAALDSVALLKDREAKPSVLRMLDDPETRVRQSAALAAGALAIKRAVEPLLKLAHDPDAQVRRACLEALRRLGDPRAVPLALAALQDSVCQLAALECIAELGGPEQLDAISAAKLFTPESTHALARTFVSWLDKSPADSPVQARLQDAVARLHGTSGTLLCWRIVSTRTADADRIEENLVSDKPASPGLSWRWGNVPLKTKAA